MTGNITIPIIAPFFADIDTRGEGSQLVLTKRSGGTFEEGDFDITFHYGSIGWETGEASDGVDGFGGTPVRAGYSLGTGVEGTFFELAGSGQTRALTDGGDRAPFTNSLNALSTPGRRQCYRYGHGQHRATGRRGDCLHRGN